MADWDDKYPSLLGLVPPRAPRQHCRGDLPNCNCADADVDDGEIEYITGDEPKYANTWQALAWSAVIILGSGVVLLSLILHTIDIMRWLFT